MLSRVADSIFWMARYMERTNGMLRVIRTNYIASQDEVKDFNWKTLLRHYSDAPVKELEEVIQSGKLLDHMLLDKKNGASVYQTVTRARENARSVQDHITKEVWQCLNDYYHLVRDKQIHSQVKQGDPVTAMDALLHHGLLYHGTVDITMSRGESFTYLNIGKFLERATLSVDILHIKLTELEYDIKNPVEVPALRYLLYSLSGYELYLKTHRGKFQADHVLQQIIFDEHFPHSVSYCLKQVNRYFERLEAESLPESYKQLEFLIGRALTQVKYHRIQLNDPEGLRHFLQQTRSELTGIAAAFNQFYFGGG